MTDKNDTHGREAPTAQIGHTLLSHFLVQGIHVAADLGIADLLAQQPKTGDELADATGAHGPSLFRLLRMLVSIGVFRQDANGQFALTRLGDTLRSGSSGSVRDLAILRGAPPFWQAWGELRYSIMTGQSAFEHLHGTTFYEYMGREPRLNTTFNDWMTRQSKQHNAAVVAAYDFSGLRLVVDVGGGRGAMLAAILRANPSVRGILFDLPQVIGESLLPEVADVAERCQVIGGDVLAAVPSGGDCYVLKRVLMDKSDEAAVGVLRKCADATAEDGRVLVIEMVILRGEASTLNTSFDLNMLVLTGGRVRTDAEFRELFAGAGLRLTRTIPTDSPNWIIEGIRA